MSEGGKRLLKNILTVALISLAASFIFFLAGKTDKAIYLVLVFIAIVQTLRIN